jgi:hypothetical protein
VFHESPRRNNINLPTLGTLLRDEAAMDRALELDIGGSDLMDTKDQASPLHELVFSPTLDTIMTEFDDIFRDPFPVDFITPSNAFITTTPISSFVSTVDMTPTELPRRPATPESPRLRGVEEYIPMPPFSGFTASIVSYKVSL